MPSETYRYRDVLIDVGGNMDRKIFTNVLQAAFDHGFTPAVGVRYNSSFDPQDATSTGTGDPIRVAGKIDRRNPETAEVDPDGFYRALRELGVAYRAEEHYFTWFPSVTNQVSYIRAYWPEMAEHADDPMNPDDVLAKKDTDAPGGLTLDAEWLRQAANVNDPRKTILQALDALQTTGPKLVVDDEPQPAPAP